MPTQVPTVQAMFERADALIEQAEAALQGVAESFIRHRVSPGYREMRDVHPRTGETLYKAKFEAPPIRLVSQTFALLDVLREAVDCAFLGSALALEHGGDVKFPFAGSRAEMEQLLVSNSIPYPLAELVRSWQPYPTNFGEKGGDDALFYFGLVSGPDYDRVPFDLIAGGTVTRTAGRAEDVFPDPIWDDAKRELLLAKTREGDFVSFKTNLTVQVTLGGSSAAGAVPVMNIIQFSVKNARMIVEELNFQFANGL